MGWSNHHLTYPFSFTDLRTALGRSSDTSKESVFANGTVKLFAKYKAFRCNTQINNRYGDHTDRSAMAYQTNYGIDIPTYYSLGNAGSSGFLYDLRNGTALWSYGRPYKSTSNLRMLDFEGYYDQAVDLMAPLSITSYTLDSQNNLTITWPSVPIVEGEDGQLLLSDLHIGGVRLSSCYFGALLFYNANQYTYIAANQNTRTVTFSNVGSYAGLNVKVIPFLSTEQISQGGTVSANVTLASFNLGEQLISLNSTLPNWSIGTGGNTWDEYGTSVAYNIRVYNNSTSSGTIDVDVWLTDNPTTASTHLRDARTRTVTVAAGGYEEVSGWFFWTKQSGVSYRIAAHGSINGIVVTNTGIYSIMQPVT